MRARCGLGQERRTHCSQPAVVHRWLDIACKLFTIFVDLGHPLRPGGMCDGNRDKVLVIKRLFHTLQKGRNLVSQRCSPSRPFLRGLVSCRVAAQTEGIVEA